MFVYGEDMKRRTARDDIASKRTTSGLLSGKTCFVDLKFFGAPWRQK